MRQAAVCPDLMQYQQLAADQLADADEEAMLEHLERCDACARKLSTLVERDRLVEFIRRYQARGDGAADEVMGRLVERMSKLRPGETPAAAGQTTPSAHITVPVAALIIACPACGKALKVKGELAGKMVKCPHCQQAVCAAAKSAGAPASGVSAAALSVTPRPGTVAGAGFRTGANVAGKPEITVDHQPAKGPDKELYGFLAPPQAPDELGRLGPYRVLQILGAGGMGVVFRAEDPQLMRLVALKAMLPALSVNASARQRFLREARAAAAIKHDHIVTIYQVGEDRGVPFLAMDFLEGEPLDARLQRAGKLPVAEVLRIGREIALGLAAANQRGLIHRDIKPANIWLETHGEPGASATGGRVKILDFGLARAVGAEAQLTQLGAIVGTPAYMAPEQGKGKTVDHRCDLFSLGCVLYRMATGEPTFRGTDVISTLMAVATENPRPPHELEATLPPALSELIMGLLAKEAGDRPLSAQVVAATLEGIAAVGAAIRAAPTLSAARLGSPGVPTAPRPRKKWPIPAGLAACLLLGVAGLWSAGVFKLKTKDGTIVLENLPADAEVFVDGEKIAVKLPGDGKPIEIQVAPGQRKLEIKTADFKMITRDVTLAAGERNPPIDIRLEPLAAVGETPVNAAWLKEVAALPVYKQAEAVAAKLKDLNPGFVGPVKPEIEGRVVTSLHFSCATVTDISPLRALPTLQTLYIGNGPLAELSPLKDMKLTGLHCPNSRVSDLSPLKDMKLTWLELHFGLVSDLSPLKDMKLTYLNCAGTRVKDLSPLKGMPLTRLECGGTFPNLAALKGMPLTRLVCKESQVYDLAPLRDMKLTELACWDSPVTDAGLMALQEMASLRQLEIVNTKTTDAGLEHLKKLTDLQILHLGFNTKLSGAGLVHLKGMSGLQHLVLGHTEVSDEGLIHLKGLLGLRVLELQRTRVTDAGLENLAGLRSLAKLNLTGTAVTDKGVAKLKAALLKCNFITDVKVPASEPAATPPMVPPVPPSAALEALRRDQIAPEALKLAGDGDANRAPSSLVAVLGEAMPIHNEKVNGLAFSPDGRWLASGSHDKTIILREVATGRVSRVLKGHTGPISSVAFSKDNRTLASASHDGTLKLWPIEKEAEPETLKPNLGEIWAMAASPDGRFLAAGGTDGTIKLWKWGQWDAPVGLPKTADKVTTLAFSPDGELLASGWEEGKPEAAIRLYSTVEGKLTQTLPGHKNRVNSLAFSPDGKSLASVGLDDNARVWNLARGKTVVDHDQRLGPGLSVAWGPDDKKLAIFRQFGGNIALFDIPSRTQQTVFPDVSAFGLVFSPDSKVLAFGSSNGSVYMVDTTSMKQKFLDAGHRHNVTTLAFSPNGRTILSGGDDSTLRRWSLDRPGENHILDILSTPVNLVAYSPDGKTFASAIRFRMSVWDAATGKERFGVAEPVVVHILAYSPDGKTLAGCALDGIVRLWDVSLGKEVHRFPYLGRANALAFSGDGANLAAVSYEKNCVKVWNVANGAEIGGWQDAFKQINWQLSVGAGATFSPDGRHLATGHDDGTITFWDVAKEQKQRTLRGHTALVTSLKFTPDGKTLVSSAHDGTIRLWNPEIERAREVIPLGPANRPLTFDLDRSGKYLFAAGHSPVIFVLRLP